MICIPIPMYASLSRLDRQYLLVQSKQRYGTKVQVIITLHPCLQCFATQRVPLHQLNIPAITSSSPSQQANKQHKNEIMAGSESAAAVGTGSDENHIFTGHSFYVSHNVPARDRFCKIIEVRGIDLATWRM